MKVEELMIGDWVTMVADAKRFSEFSENVVGETIPCKVIGLDEYKTDAVRVANNFSFMDEDPEKISPIPLTPKFLEKNDFKKHDIRHIKGQHQWTWVIDMMNSVSLWCRELYDKPNDGWTIRIESSFATCQCKVEYVHQLQHALRLCGINKEIVL